MTTTQENSSGAAQGDLDQVVRELLDRPVSRVEPLAVDAYNAHYRVDLPEGRYHMVRYFNTGDAALEGIGFEHAVLIHLEDRGFDRLPRLLRHQGETIFRRGEDYFAFSEWIEGCATVVDRPISSGQVEGLARCAAALHRAMEGFERRLAFLPAHRFVYPADEVRRQAEALTARLAEVAVGGGEASFDDEARAALRLFLPRVPARLEAFPWPLYNAVHETSPQRLVHGDLRLLNLVFAGDEVGTVLDFNASFNELRLWDLSYTALSLAGTETLGAATHPERAVAFLRAYQREHPLDAAEQELLPPFLIFTVLKLMLASYCSWWVVQRAPLLEQLESGLAREIVEKAF